MNLDFLRFQRHLLTMALGGIFLAEVFFLLRGDNAIRDFTKAFEFFEGLDGAGGVAIAAILLASVIVVTLIGARLLGGIVALGSYVVARGTWQRGKSVESELVLPTAHLMVLLVQRSRKELVQYFRLRTMASARSWEHHDFLQKEVPKLANAVVRFIGTASNMDMLTAIVYFTQVTQEKVVSDKLRVDVDALQYTWVIVIVAVIVVARFGGDAVAVTGAFLVATGYMAMTVPLFRRLKRRLAYHQIYLMFETMGVLMEGAEIADREAI